MPAANRRAIPVAPRQSVLILIDALLTKIVALQSCLAPGSNVSLLRSRGFISVDAAATRLICEVAGMMHVDERHSRFDADLMRGWFEQAYGRLERENIDLVDRTTAWSQFEATVSDFKPKIMGLAKQLGYPESEFTTA